MQQRKYQDTITSLLRLYGIQVLGRQLYRVSTCN